MTSIAQMLQDTRPVRRLPLWENILESRLPAARTCPRDQLLGEDGGPCWHAMVEADGELSGPATAPTAASSGGDGGKMALYAAGDPLCGALLSPR